MASNDHLLKATVAANERQKRKFEEFSKENGSQLKLKEEQLISLSQTKQNASIRNRKTKERSCKATFSTAAVARRNFILYQYKFTVFIDSFNEI
jgi:hypothetical protein